MTGRGSNHRSIISVSRIRDADLRPNNRVKIATMLVDIFVPTLQLADFESPAVRFCDAIARVARLDRVNIALMRHTELRAWFWEVRTSRLKTIEPEQADRGHLLSDTDGMAVVSILDDVGATAGPCWFLRKGRGDRRMRSSTSGCDVIWRR